MQPWVILRAKPERLGQSLLPFINERHAGENNLASALDLSRRLTNYYSKTYLLKSNKGKTIVYNALLKNGHSAFKLDILEYCAPSDVIKREQHFNLWILMVLITL